MFNQKNNLFEVTKQKLPSSLLTDRFLIPPFSVFDTKQGYWQKRKKQWVNLGIKSEIGRGDNLADNISDFGNCHKKENFGKCLPESIGVDYGRKIQATSIFDPVLCEIIYRWFSVENAKIIDPFSGGSVRGVVAACLGRDYVGVDLSGTQVKVNKVQYLDIKNKYININGNASWYKGDSLYVKDIVPGEYDLLFTCPPYYDLEVYSDDPGDISNFKTYEDFILVLENIIKNTLSMLKNNSFAVCVVGDVRDKTNGSYYNFVGDVINIFKKSKLHYYNEGILVNVAGTLPIRASKQFNSGRKFGKQHQNILVFYKGDTKKIKDKFKDVVITDITL